MAPTRQILAGLLVIAGALSMGVSSCEVSSPADDLEPIATTTEAVGGAVGDWTGFTDGQCVHGVYAFYHTRFGVTLTGTCASPTTGNCETCGACEIWKGAAVEPPSSLFNKYTWGTTMPQLYDIVVYPPKTAAVGPGHVACVDHIDSTNPSDWQAMYVMDSNWYGNEKAATSVHTVTRAPYGIFRLKSLDNPPPKGYLDTADCTGITGWTQDPSKKTAAINADLYFNGSKSDASAIKIRLLAGTDRPDLCAPLGSCNHAYALATPRGAMDGADHKVYAYGIDSGGGKDPLLTDAPKTFNCAAPAIPTNVVKRTLTSAAVLSAWQFQTFFDLAVYASPDVDAVASGADIPASPSLIQVKDRREIDVVDGTERRPISGAASFAAWRFTTDMITSIQESELASYTLGKDWPATPLLIKSTDSDTVYLLDGELPTTGTPANPDGAGAGGSSGLSAENDNANPKAANGCNIGAGTSSDPTAAWLVSIIGLIVARRRRAAR